MSDRAVVGPERLMTAVEVADYINMSKEFVYRAARGNEIPHVRLGRAVRFRRSEVDIFLSRRRRTGP